MGSNIYFIDNGPSVLLVDLNSLRTCEINKQDFTADAVKRAVAEHFSDSRPYFERLKPKKLTDDRISPTIVTSFACNYACEYCYQRPSKGMYDRMTPHGIDAIYGFYKFFCEKHQFPFEFDYITVIGGEPLLPENRAVLRRIVEVWSDQPLRITTNGAYLLDYAEFLIAHNVELTVSLDGTEQTHFARRKTADPLAYRKAIDGIRLLLSNNLKISISAVFSPKNLNDYCAFFDEMETLGWLKNPNLCLTFLGEDGFGTDDRSYESVMQNLEAFVSLRRADKRAWYVNARKLLPGGTALTDALELASFDEYRPYRCGCLYNPSFAFLPDGSVMPCLSIQDSRFQIGRFLPEPELNEEYYTALANRRIDRMEKCRECSKRVLCKGSCLSTVLHKQGNCTSIDCSMWQNLDFLSYYEAVMAIKPLADSTQKQST